jgi:hypothetical protein
MLFFSPEDGDSMFLRNVIYLRIDRVQKPRRTTTTVRTSNLTIQIMQIHIYDKEIRI